MDVLKLVVLLVLIPFVTVIFIMAARFLEAARLRRGPGTPIDAAEVARQRLARGEIKPEEYEKIKSALKK